MTEYKKCIVCLKEFEVATGSGKLGNGIKPRNYVTCSKEHSRIYERIYKKIIQRLKT